MHIKNVKTVLNEGGGFTYVYQMRYHSDYLRDDVLKQLYLTFQI